MAQSSSNFRNATTRSPLFSGLQKLELDGDWREQVEKECTDSLRIIHEVTETNSWSMADAVYFTMTTITSIGYGHIVPMTKAGKRFCVVYTLVGVPVTCILLTNYADMLCNCIFQLYTTAKKRHQRHQKALLHGIILMVICVGLTLLTLLPSVVLSKLEDWSYEDALYFTFNTITTIGFGDLIAGDNTDVPYRDLYKMGIVVWIMLVLIYWFLLHSFLKKALKNVAVHKIKKTKNMSTRVTMQSAFFTELVGKVVSQRVHEVKHKDELASDPEMVALILAVADVLDPRRTFHEHKIIPTVQVQFLGPVHICRVVILRGRSAPNKMLLRSLIDDDCCRGHKAAPAGGEVCTSSS
ncbi:potassium channel subfamily K member 2 isoform X2 [Procambarus clarkii]|uniref:potassium channel subfamily K member 2 isoform X2 n=1 Tax=Procambarus clarkii TaxID=6728 RepID=UPI0037446385